jgi:gluconate 2-dehydrogenase gamma chain
MTVEPSTRRDFLADTSRAVTAGWLSLQLPWLAALAGCARDDARKDNPFVTLTAAEGRAMRAFAAQIIPSDDDGPGAEEAGAVYFVDRALGMPFFADKVPIIRAGLADLDAWSEVIGIRGGFASVSGAQQVAIIGRIEHTPFFAAARALAVIGTFANPSYGGNKGGAGWKMIGIDHQSTYTAPFGWYDDPLGTDPPKGTG